MFIILILAALATSSPGFAQSSLPNDFTVEGRIYQTDGVTPINTNADIVLEVLNDGDTCVLYSETWSNVNLYSSNANAVGAFALQLGAGTANTPFVASPNLATLFSSGTSIPGYTEGTNVTYGSGCTATPVSSDHRIVRVKVRLTSVAGAYDTLSPDTRITAVPTAIVAENANSLQGKTAANFLLTNTNTSLIQSNVENVFSSANYTALTALLAGTSYIKAAPTAPVSFNSQRLTAIADPTSAQDAATKNYADLFLGGKSIDITGVGPGLGGGRTLTWDSTLNKWVTSAIGGVASITAGTGLGGGTITTAGTLSVDVGVGANQILQLNSSAKIPAVDGSLLVNVNAIIQPNAVTSAKINNAGIAVNRLLITDATTGATVGYSTCTLGELLQWSTSGWACTPVTTVLGPSGVTPATYGNGAQVAQVRVDAQGRVTALTNVNIAFPVTTVAGHTGAVTLNAADVAGLGTAALQNYGTGANQLLPLNASAQLPAVDGNLLTNLNASNLGVGTIAAARLPALSGDVTSSPGSTVTVVARIQGNTVKAGAPTDGQVLTWVASNGDWEYSTPVNGSVTNVTGNGPITVANGTSTPAISIQLADTTHDGYLNQADWNTFNGKLGTALTNGKIWVGSPGNIATSVAPSGDLTMTNAGAFTVASVGGSTATLIHTGELAANAATNTNVISTIVKRDPSGNFSAGTITATGEVIGSLQVTGGTPAVGKLLTSDASGNATWQPPATNGTVTNIITGAGLTGGPISITGTISLANTAVWAASYGSSNQIPTYTVDAQGRLTNAANVTVNDTTKLPLTGGAITGAINMGGFDISNIGNLGLNAQKTLGLGTYTTGQETTLIGSLAGADTGKIWYNSSTNQMKFWDGTAPQALGVSGAGLTSLNGLIGNAQTFANGTAGTSPQFNSSGAIHTLNIPMAATGSVTAGLISNNDYLAFNGKLGTNLNSAQIWVGSGGNVATSVAPSGDLTMTNVGTFTVTQIRGKAVDTVVPTDTQFLVYNNGTAKYSPVTMSGDASMTNAGAITVATIGGATATNAATPNTIVKRDASGNFSAGTITATGEVTGSLQVTGGTPAVGKLLTSDASGNATWQGLPNPSTVTLGGVNSYAGSLHQWINAISTSGVPSSTQPAFTDISGTATNAQIPVSVVYNNTPNTFNTAGAVSTPAIKLSGSPYTAGSTSTTKPLLLIEDAVISSGWSTAGTYLGINAAGGFAGNLIDLQLNGVNKFRVDTAGKIYGDGSTLTNLTSQVAGANGQIQFNNGGTSFGASNKLNWDNINFRLGVGNSVAPLSTLDVSGGVAVGSPYAGTIAAPTNGMIVSGNVGIGTTVPANSLDVNGGVAVGSYAGTAAGAGNLIVSGNVGVGTNIPNTQFHLSSANTAETDVQIQNTSAGGKSFILSSTGSTSGIGPGNFAIVDNTATTVRLVVLSNGNVGIGTTLPNYLLDVNGSMNVSGSLNAPTITTPGVLNMNIGNASSTTTIQGSNVAIYAPVTIGSLGAGTIALGNPSTSTINVGTATSAGSEIVTIGSTFGGSGVNIQSGTGGINVGTTATTTGVAVGGTALTALNLGGSATGALTAALGSMSGASTTTIQGGTGGISLMTPSTGPINIGVGATNTVSIGGIALTNLVLGSASTAALAVTLGSSSALSSTTIKGGATGGIVIGAGNTPLIGGIIKCSSAATATTSQAVTNCTGIPSGGAGWSCVCGLNSVISGAIPSPTTAAINAVKAGYSAIGTAAPNNVNVIYTTTLTIVTNITVDCICMK